MTTPFPPLITATDLSLRLDGAPPTPSWAPAIEDASNALRGVIGQPLSPATTEISIRVDCNGIGRIPFCPVVSVDAVSTPDGTPLPTDGTGFDVDGQTLIVMPAWWRRGPRRGLDAKYSATIQHGYDPIPGELLGWVYVLAAAQIAAVEQGIYGGVGAISSVAVDDARVNYSVEQLMAMIPDKVQVRLRAWYGGAQ